MKSSKPSSRKYLCVHGHFYQPPRENPWLEIIEIQKSARPYHDWNERITRECYGPNTRSRLHGRDDRILKLINNFEYMSFNFGPTLISWLEAKHPWIYSQILKADRKSQEKYAGHGNALAQVYNHIIMPLASTRDKLTQIRWGKTDFRHRFGRDPEGMWLAETAVDLETLDLMAKEGIRFTILSPTQAKSIRPLAKRSPKGGKAPDPGPWQDVSGGKIDTTRPYRVVLNGKDRSFIDVFFYDGPLSKSIAYEKVLASGEDLLARIHRIFDTYNDGPRLVNVATDGESYGHHFKFGEMALSWLFNRVEGENEIFLTNYGQFLELFPPEKEVELFENSAWSCSHGVGRWYRDCGCSVGRNPSWNQKWRGPLREGMDWLSKELASIFERQAQRLLKDPWRARDDYIKVLLDPSDKGKAGFIGRNSSGIQSDEQKTELFQLMESQRMSLYMFTSCGWFFDDISGLEATQVLMYASRAMELVREWSSVELENGFMNFLFQAKSNDPSYGNGGKIYQERVKPSRIDPSFAAAHYAIASLVEELSLDHYPFPPLKRVLYERRFKDSGVHLCIGEISISEEKTGRKFRKGYLAFRRKGSDLGCIVGSSPGIGLEQMSDEIRNSLEDFSYEILEQIFKKHVPEFKKFFLKDLIPDAKKFIIKGLADDLDRLAKKWIGAHEESIGEVLEMLQEADQHPSHFLRGFFYLPFLKGLYDRLMPDTEKNEIDWKDLTDLASLCEPPSFHALSKEPAINQFLRQQMDSFADTGSIVFLKNMINFLIFIRNLDVEPDLWECQNLFYDLRQDPKFIHSLDPDVLILFRELGAALGFLFEETKDD